MPRPRKTTSPLNPTRTATETRPRPPISPTRWRTLQWWYSEPANVQQFREWIDGPLGRSALSVLWNSIPMDETQYKGYMLCLRTLEQLAEMPSQAVIDPEADFGASDVLRKWESPQ